MRSRDQKPDKSRTSPSAEKTGSNKSAATTAIADNRSAAVAQRKLQQLMQKQADDAPELMPSAQNRADLLAVKSSPAAFTPVQREPEGQGVEESARLKKVRELAGETPTHDSVFDAYVATLKADGFKYTSSSPGGTDVLNGSNSGACGSIAFGLNKAFKAILGADQGKANQEILNVYVPIDGDYVEPGCAGNVVNDTAYYFGKHYYLDGFDPTSGKKGGLAYNVCEDSSLYDWVRGFDIALQREHQAFFQGLTGKVTAVRKFGSSYVLRIGESNTYYKVEHSEGDIEALRDV